MPIDWLKSENKSSNPLIMNVKKIKNPLKKIMIVLRDSERKNITKMIGEFIYLALKDKAIPYRYFSRFLYRKEKTNLDDFERNKTLRSLHDKFNNTSFVPILRNKLVSYKFFSQHGVKMPEIMLYNNYKYFMYEDKLIVVSNPALLHQVLLQLFDTHKGLNAIFIKKTSGSWGGDNIYKIKKEDLDNSNLIEDLFPVLTGSGYLFQEAIQQNHLIDIINPNCINTLRIDTFIDENGHIDVISAFIRLGLGSSIVDNISSGGCQVGIDLDSALMKKYGYTNITVGSGRVLTKHPATGTVFEKYAIPFFKESLELVKKTAELLFPVRLVGWDIGITPQGPVLIEGNHHHDMTSTDMALNGCRKSKVFQKILEEAKRIK